MKPKLLILTALLTSVLHSFAAVTIDEDAFGKSLGGWKKQKGTAAEYPLSGADYRTYKPEISPTPDGGIFISVRIDHVRGWLSSDDHAILEISVSNKGAIVSAQSSIAIQGRSIKSDVILGSNEAGKSILTPERAVQVGTDLVADLSAKLLRENIVEAGRVSFPSVLRHNYNHLFQAIRVEGVVIEAAKPVTDDPGAPAPSSAPAAAASTTPAPASAPPATPPAAPADPAPAAAPAAAPSPTPAPAPAPEKKDEPAPTPTPAPEKKDAPAPTPEPKPPGSVPLEIKPYN